MASRTIYPPLVNSYEPAFVAGTNSSLRVYFSLSSLSSSAATFLTSTSAEGTATAFNIQAQIFNQNGKSVVNTKNDGTRYRAAGVILNLEAKQVKTGENYYYVTINNNDIQNGWTVGMKYKIQLRLSTVLYNPNIYPKQEVWLQEFSNSFSEWSTFCYTKAISTMTVQIPLFEFDSSDKTIVHNEDTVYNLISMNLFGSIFASNQDSNELYNTVRISLYQGEELIEDSGDLDRSSFGNESPSYFEYDFKTNFINLQEYKLSLTYETENEYVPENPYIFRFVINSQATEPLNAQLVTVDHDTQEILKDITCLDNEEDEGRIALKIYSTMTDAWSGNLCIRRSSQDTNFQVWEDIKIIIVREKNLNELDLIYDYTIESGVWYKYGIQLITTEGDRGILNEISSPIQRLFNYSFILGQNNKQLRLQFDNTMNSFRHQLLDTKTDTIGSQYPFISRNAVVNYKTFPVNGLISYWMDENNVFLPNGKKDIYKYNSIVKLYDDYALEHNRYEYDYTYERDFRKLVLDFLQDGKPKLFKSPTEGNVIVRLMDVSCTPNQTLDRMLYSMSSTANEIDDNTMKNYLKYGFYNPGTYSKDFSIFTTYIGQIDGKFLAGRNEAGSDNVFKKIYEKYDSQGKNYAGYTKKLQSISRVCITINGYYMNNNGVETFVPGHQLRVMNSSGNIVMGNNILLNYRGSGSTLITIYDPRGMYEFDSLLTFYYTGDPLGNDSLYFLCDEEGYVTAVDATIDFIYSLSSAPYKKHEVLQKTPITGIGQFYEEVKPGTNIYNTIYYQRYVESNSVFKYMNAMSSIEIEANPHTVFGIKDASDTEIQYHEINETGVLRLYELSNIMSLTYIGKRYLKTPYDESTVSEEIITEDVLGDDNHYIIKGAADVSITYRFVDVQGIYKEG